MKHLYVIIISGFLVVLNFDTHPKCLKPVKHLKKTSKIWLISLVSLLEDHANTKISFLEKPKEQWVQDGGFLVTHIQCLPGSRIYPPVHLRMVEGGGRLDLTCKRDYSVQEARSFGVFFSDFFGGWECTMVLGWGGSFPGPQVTRETAVSQRV